MESVEKLVKTIESVGLASLERKGKDFDFSDIFPNIEYVYERGKLIQKNSNLLENLPENKRNSLIAHLNTLTGYIERIINFDANTGRNGRDQIADSFNEAYNHFLEIDYLLRIDEISYRIIESNVDEITNEVKNSYNEISNIKKETEKILKNVREASAEIGVSQYAQVFSDEANNHKLASIIWLIVSILISIGISCFIFWTFNELNISIQQGIDIQTSIQLFLAKLLLVSFLSVVFYQAVKNYSAQMHLNTVNRHRANSMKTFQAFVEGTDNERVKDAVLLQATKSIFETGQTGYITAKEKGSTGTEIIKVIENIGKPTNNS